MSNRYVLIKQGPAKVPVLAMSNKLVILTSSTKLTITASVERLLIYYQFVLESRQLFSEQLQTCFKGGLNPLQIDELWDVFKKHHKPIPVSSFPYSDIPPQADKTNGLEIPIPSYVCTISYDDEIVLLDILKEQPDRAGWERIKQWFYRYCSRYALNYDKKCKGEQYTYLADSFYEQHGVDPSRLPLPERERKIEECSSTKKYLIVWSIIAVWIFLAVGLIALGDRIARTYLIVGLIIIFLGFIILGLFVNFFENGPKTHR